MNDGVTVVQARVSSTRLPGKVLLPIGDEPMVLHVLRRAQAIGLPVILATSDNPSDDPLAERVSAAGFDVARGSENDVLDRFLKAIPAGAELVVRITADCPLLDPAVGRAALQVLREAPLDYVSNVLRPTFPDGLDCEAIRVSALRRSWAETDLPSDREHVTMHIRRRPDRFRAWDLSHVPDLSAERWTVDDERDIAFVRSIVSRLPSGPEGWSMYAVLALLAREPELRDLNPGRRRNEALERDIDEERRAVEVRVADWEDRTRLLAWANDPETRRNSFDPHEIALPEHLAWLRARLAERPPSLYVGVIRGRPFGVVRFEQREGRTEISVTIDPDYRGKSLAAPLLDAARRARAAAATPGPILARVKVGNDLSRRAFQRAGYRVVREAEGVLEMVFDPD